MAGRRYPSDVLAEMRWVRLTAERSPEAVCWWCGGRPWDGQRERWAADHLYPRLGVRGPLVSACGVHNVGRRRQLPEGDQVLRVLRSPFVVRSCSGEELEAIGVEACVELFGRGDVIDLLMAADPVSSTNPRNLNVYYQGTKIIHKGYQAMLRDMEREHV